MTSSRSRWVARLAGERCRKELWAGLVRLDGCSALRAEERAALGDGPPDGVDDERKSHFRDLTRRLGRSVGRASSGSGLDFLGHGLPPVTVGAWLPGLASERQPAEPADRKSTRLNSSH